MFAIEDFFPAAMRAELSRNYTIAILHRGTVYFSNARGARASRRAHQRALMRIEDQPWTLRVAPTPAFVSARNPRCRRWCWPRACWWRRWRHCRCATS